MMPVIGRRCFPTSVNNSFTNEGERRLLAMSKTTSNGCNNGNGYFYLQLLFVLLNSHKCLHGTCSIAHQQTCALFSIELEGRLPIIKAV